MERPFQYLEPAAEPEGTALGVGVSLTLHVAALLVAFLGIREVPQAKEEPLRYVELVPRATAPATPGASRTFVEAPGPAVEQPPSPTAPLSDANRRASTPNPTGATPTRRPGDGSGGLFVPGNRSAPAAESSAPPQRPPAAAEQPRGNGEEGEQVTAEGLRYEVAAGESRSPEGASATDPAIASIDWNSAIRDAGKVASLGSGGRVGGEQGFAESGPISFESQWYDWGPYAAQMVAKIRLHWYNNMPEIIRMGMKGVVVIRFTIQRNGQITDVTMLQSSDIPPYDFAATKAIQLASPLAPLPADFPQATERVTAGFYYNSNPPK